MIESDVSGKTFAWRGRNLVQEVMQAGADDPAGKASGGQSLAAFRSTGTDNLAATAGRHASAEAVRALALDVARLECALHRNLLATTALPCGLAWLKGERILGTSTGGVKQIKFLFS
jgi:hypothetical protein